MSRYTFEDDSLSKVIILPGQPLVNSSLTARRSVYREQRVKPLLKKKARPHTMPRCGFAKVGEEKHKIFYKSNYMSNEILII